MFFEDLNWMDVESYLEHDDRLIFVTGSTEQHAYLSLLTDIRIPVSLAAAVARHTNILVAPPLNFGASPYFTEYPGTISISQETFNLVMTEIITGLVQQGFRRILILNGHGGNAFPSGVQALIGEVDGLHVKWHNWWQSPVARRVMGEFQHEGTHANWMENFPFTRVAELPRTTKPFIDFSQILQESGGIGLREKLGDGSFGGVYELPDELMQHFFDVLVHEIAALVEQWD